MTKSSGNKFTVYEANDPNALDEYSETLGEELEAEFNNVNETSGTSTDTFSTSETYAVGEIVIYNNKLYKCIIAITTAGEWDSTKWTETSLQEEIETLKEEVEANTEARHSHLNKLILDAITAIFTTEKDTKLSNIESGATNTTKTSDLTNDSGFITNAVNNLTNYELKSSTGSSITLSIDNSTYVMTLQLKNSAGTVISTGTVDLPLETMVVNATYNNTTKKIILTLQNGNTVEFSVADLVSGLVDEATFNDAIAMLQETISAINTRVVALERKTGKVYGIKRKITDNTATTWTRIEDSVGKVANAKKATSSAVQNDFTDIYPWSAIKTCNVDSNGNITNYIDEPGFAFDGSNGEVMTRIPTLWFKREIIADDYENDWEYIYIADYPKEGFSKVDEFLIARYNLSLDSNNKAHSISGAVPKYNSNIASFRTYARNLSTKYCLMDWRAFVLQMLYLVEYADYNSQNILGQGIVTYSSAKAIKAESSVNRIIVTSVGTGLYVGKTICIGTSATFNSGVAQNRQITAIESYDDGTITGYSITFDGDAVNIAVDNVIWGCAQSSGDCDSLGMESGCLINDGYHSMIYRGVENIFGNVWQHIDGINIKDYQSYICYDPSQYVSDKFTAPYTSLGYVNANTSDSYIKKLGYDANNPAIALPTVVGGSSSTCVADNYWCNSGNRIAYLGGNFNNYWAKGGFFAWRCNSASSYSNWGYGARLLKYQ